MTSLEVAAQILVEDEFQSRMAEEEFMLAAVSFPPIQQLLTQVAKTVKNKDDLILEGPDLSEAVWFTHSHGNRKGNSSDQKSAFAKPQHWVEVGRRVLNFIKAEPEPFLEKWSVDAFSCRDKACPMPHRCAVTADKVARNLAIKGDLYISFVALKQWKAGKMDQKMFDSFFARVLTFFKNPSAEPSAEQLKGMAIMFSSEDLQDRITNEENYIFEAMNYSSFQELMHQNVSPAKVRMIEEKMTLVYQDQKSGSKTLTFELAVYLYHRIVASEGKVDFTFGTDDPRYWAQIAKRFTKKFEEDPHQIQVQLGEELSTLTSKKRLPSHKKHQESQAAGYASAGPSADLKTDKASSSEGGGKAKAKKQKTAKVETEIDQIYKIALDDNGEVGKWMLEGDEVEGIVDRKIFNSVQIQGKLMESPEKFAKVLEYPKFRPFCLEMNKRYLYCAMECFKELVNYEMRKAKPKAKKAGGQNKASAATTQGQNLSQESQRFTEACLEVLRILDKWNTEDQLCKPLFQGELRYPVQKAMAKMFEEDRRKQYLPAEERRGHQEVSPKIWKTRINQVRKELPKKKQKSMGDFLEMLEYISTDLEDGVPEGPWYIDALLTKAVPLTAEEEKSLLGWRRLHEERFRKINFYEFVKDIVRKLKDPSWPEAESRIHRGMTRDEINIRVFYHKNFKAMMAYKDFRRYVFCHPDYKNLCAEFNKNHLEHLMNIYQEPPKKPPHGKKTESKKDNKKWQAKHLKKLETFQSRHETSDPNFIPKLEKTCFNVPKSDYQVFYTTSRESDEMKQKLGDFNSAKERFEVQRNAKKDIEDKISSDNLLPPWNLAEFLGNEHKDEPLKFWNNAKLTLVKQMLECGMVFKDVEGIPLGLKKSCDTGVSDGPPEDAATAEVD